MPLIRIRDLKGGTKTETRYSGEFDKRYVVRKGDFLIGMDGEFGCFEWLGQKALLNQRVCRLHSFASTLEGRFLFYGINKFLKDIEDATSFTTVKHISSKQIAAIEFPIPPLAEQRRIVTILDEAFAGLEVMRANAEKNLQNARELFDRYLQSVLRQRGPGWAEKTLQSVSIEFGRGKSKHRPRGDARLLGGKYPFIQTGDVANSNHRIIGYSQTYNEAGLAQSKLWPKGTVCIAIVGANVAETAILGFDACFPDSVIGLVVNEKQADNEYVEFLLQTYKAALKERGKGTARDNINLATFETHTFPFPSIAQQKQIVARINDLSEQTQSLESIYRQKLAAIAELKQSILQKSFSGQLISSEMILA